MCGGRRARRRGRSATFRPCQTSRFVFFGVRSGFVVSASNQTTSAAQSASATRSAAGLKVIEPGRKSTPRFEPTLATSRSWTSSSGSDSAICASRSTATRSGTSSPSARPISPASHSGDERARALAGAAELHDVQPVVVGLDEAGQRAALAERRHVARGLDPDAGQGATVAPVTVASPARRGSRADARRPRSPPRPSRRRPSPGSPPRSPRAGCAARHRRAAA